MPLKPHHATLSYTDLDYQPRLQARMHTRSMKTITWSLNNVPVRQKMCTHLILNLTPTPRAPEESPYITPHFPHPSKT